MSEEKSIEKSFVVSHLIKQNKQLKQRNEDLEAIVTNIQATIDYLHYDDRKIFTKLSNNQR